MLCFFNLAIDSTCRQSSIKVLPEMNRKCRIIISYVLNIICVHVKLEWNLHVFNNNMKFQSPSRPQTKISMGLYILTQIPSFPLN